MLARQRLPEEHADPPHVGRGGGRQSLQSLRRDVGKRPRDVPERSQRVEFRHLREPEVEQAYVHDARLGVQVLSEEDVRRFHVPVDDPLAVGVGQCLGDLCGDLDRGRVVELPCAHRLTQRATGDVLVGDVDVGLVPRQRDDPLAARMTERGGSSSLTFGAVPRLALAGDDLQCDVETASFIPGQPHVTHPAGAQRA